MQITSPPHAFQMVTPKANLQKSLIALQETKPAIFIDRDGTINEDRGYICSPNDLVLLPNAAKALGKLNTLGFIVVIITNQSAIARGMITQDDLHSINTSMWKQLQNEGAKYDALYYCPHSPSDYPPCECRKPQPGMIFQAAYDLRINLAQSFMIGDKIIDIQAGKAAGCRTCLVQTGYAGNDITTNRPQVDFIATDIFDAVNWITTFSDFSS